MASESSSVSCRHRASGITPRGFGWRETLKHNLMYLFIFSLLPLLACVACCSVSLASRGAGFRARLGVARGASFLQNFRVFPALSPTPILLAQPVSPADARVSARVFPVTLRARAANFGRWAA